MPVCPNCGDEVDDRDATFHPGCCPHEDVEADDDGGVNHYFWCNDCNARVHPVNDDGTTSWETE